VYEIDEFLGMIGSFCFKLHNGYWRSKKI